MESKDYNQAKDIFIKAAKKLPEHAEELNELMIIAIDVMQDCDDVELELKELESDYKKLFEREGVEWQN